MHNNDTIVSNSSHSSLVVYVIFIIILKLNPPCPCRSLWRYSRKWYIWLRIDHKVGQIVSVRVAVINDELVPRMMRTVGHRGRRS